MESFTKSTDPRHRGRIFDFRLVFFSERSRTPKEDDPGRRSPPEAEGLRRPPPGPMSSMAPLRPTAAAPLHFVTAK